MKLVFDLNKAIDKSKLVQVQVLVHGKNGTFMRNQWKNPADVSSSDKVIGNQAVLDAYKKEQQKKAAQQSQAAVNFDLSKWNALKVANDRDGAMAYAKQCGVVWKEDASNPGINWMRACMAANKAAGGTVTVGKTTGKPASTKSVKKLNVDGIAGFDTMDGKAKVKALLAGGKNTRDDLTAFASSMGITWTSTDKNGNPLPDGIAWMRCSMALQKYLEGKTAANVNDGSSGDSTSTAQAAPAPAPKPVSDKIEITPSMTPRQVNLANLINGITDEDELELIKSSHVVAEDDNARKYIKETLYKSYTDWKSGNAAQSNLYRKDAYASTFAKKSADEIGGIFKGVAKKITKKGIWSLIEDSTTSLNTAVLAYPRDIMAATTGTGHSSWNDVANATYEEVGGTGNFANLFQMLRETDEFSTMADGDDLKSYGCFAGYSNSYSTRYTNGDFRPQDGDLSKHGFIHVLDRIAEGEPSTQSEVNRIKKCYEEMITAAGGANSLPVVMSNSYEKIKEQVEYDSKYLDAMKVYSDCITSVKKKYGLSGDDVRELVERIYYNDDYTIKKSGTVVTDKLGTPVKFDPFSYQSSFVNKYNESIKSVINLGSYSNENARYLLWCLASVDSTFDDVLANPQAVTDKIKTLRTGYTPDYLMSAITTRKSELSALSGITESAYCKIKQLQMDMFQQKAVYKDTSAVNDTWHDADTSIWTAEEWDDFSSGMSHSNRSLKYACAKNGDNEELDTVLANITYIIANKAMLNSVKADVLSGSTISAANSQGTNYDGNFDYLRGFDISLNGGKIYGQGRSVKTYTADEINKRILEQLHNAPVLTTAKRRQLTEFVDEHGKYYTSKWGTAPTAGSTADKIKKASSYSFRSEETIGGFKGTPLHDIFTEQMQNLALYCPQMRNTRINSTDKLKSQVADKMGNTPYAPPTPLSSGSVNVTHTNAEKLKQLRTEALSAANCSLATCQGSDEQAIQTRIKHDWDISTYHTNSKYHSGSGRIYTHVKAVFNGVYAINNSANQERFEKLQKKTGETPVSLFHGCKRHNAFWTACYNSGFYWESNGGDNGRMLGDGVYLADLAGKSAGYLGKWGSGYGKEGCMFICDAMLGKEYVSTSHSDARAHNKVGSVDTVSMQAGTSLGGTRALRADEWCVNKADRVSPRYIIDMLAADR